MSREIYCACVVVAMCVSRELAYFILCPKRTVWCLLWCLTWEESHFPCGIHFVYAKDSTESREEEEEEEEPHTKRLKCSSTPKQLVLFGTKINL